MNIDQIFGGASTAVPGTGKKELGQDDFLRLLVAQMKNQDPSNPADNAQFLSQIAQFSMVSGIDELGTSFNGIAASFQTTQAMQAAELVGREVLADGNVLALQAGETYSGMVAVPEFTDDLVVQIKSASGSVVASVPVRDLGNGSAEFSWNGLDANGNPWPEGDYLVGASGLVQGTRTELPLALYQRVTSINVGPGGAAVQLQLGNGQQVSFPQVSQYR